jgi:hypothetical protein
MFRSEFFWISVFLVPVVLLCSCQVATEENQDGDRIATAAFSNQFKDSNNPIHEIITEDGLYFLKQRVRKYIALHNASYDAFNILTTNAHFDDCRFFETSTKIRLDYSTVVQNILSFPNYNDLPEYWSSTTGLPQLAISGATSLSAFAEALHSIQDFYSHTNWVEYGRNDLFANDVSEFPILYPWSSQNGLMIVEKITTSLEPGPPLPPGWSAHTSSMGNAYPDNMKVTVRYRGTDYPALTSGRFGLNPTPTSCPDFRGPGLGIISHDNLNKDDILHHPLQFALAKELATLQTRHEWCRLMNLTYSQYGESGTKFLCDNWVEDKNAANAACPMLAEEGLCSIPVNLDVNIAGIPGGTIGSVEQGLGGGIDCPAVRCRGQFEKDEVVHLFAQANPGSGVALKEWSGDCSNTGANTSVTLNSDKVCTAEFECPSNQPKWNAGTGKCETCPPGMPIWNSSANTCQACDPGTQWDSTTMACVPIVRPATGSANISSVSCVQESATSWRFTISGIVDGPSFAHYHTGYYLNIPSSGFMFSSAQIAPLDPSPISFENSTEIRTEKIPEPGSFLIVGGVVRVWRSDFLTILATASTPRETTCWDYR